MCFFASVIYIFVLDWSCSAVVKRLLLTNYVFFRCCGEAAEKKNGSARFTLLSLLTILFVCFSAAKFTYIIFYLLYFCVFLCGEAAEKKMVPGSGSVHLHYLLYFCVFLCGEAAEKKMVPGSVHLHYLLYFCVFLCGEAAEKKMVVFTLH